MRLRHRNREAAGEPHYDTTTLPQVAALATRLQNAHKERLTRHEMESIGAEVGLDPRFIQQALAQLKSEPPASGLDPGKIKTACWWGAGWCIPILTALLIEHLNLENPLRVIIFIVVMVAWVLPGTLLSFYWTSPRSRPPASVSRETLLDMLFALQSQLERQKQHLAFLSVDVVGSTEMKRNAPELAVEYSFHKFRSLAEGIVEACGGELQSAAGDGLMCLFAADAGSVRAARQLLEALPRFNREQNRLPAPFQIRCGISAGEVAIDDNIPLGHLQSPVIDRAATLQKRAAPGSIMFSAELSAAARSEIGGLEPLPEPVAGEHALVWRADKPLDLPALDDPDAATDSRQP